MYMDVIYEKKDGLAWIRLNRPKSLNSFNDTLVEQLHQALDKLASDSEVRVGIITGEGKAFCAGGDLTYLETLAGPTEQKAFIEKVGQLVQKITIIPKPITAMVNGVAAGAGANLMLACDLIYASETARFAQSFSKVGLVPDCGGFYFLPKTVGIHKAKELMFTADIISADEAEKLGMVNHLCSAETLQETTELMARRLVVSAPISLGFIKEILNKANMDLCDVLFAEATVQPLCLGSADCAEGIAAFKEKRVPKFTGK
jgi:2-(1,2-epoxy-1,2-dihydrophenyl)acetyl-CoA isomerase